jgi:anti-sigma factor RsiW
MIDPQVRCVELVELVTDWMEGELDDAARADVEEHLVVCRPCTAYVSQIRRTIGVMQNLDMDEPSPAFREDLQRAFRSRGGD